jgi:hypothetical protein
MVNRCIPRIAALVAAAVVLCSGGPASSQSTQPAQPPASTQPAQPSGTPPSCADVTKDAEVKDAFKLSSDQQLTSEPDPKAPPPVRTVQLNDKIAVEVENLSKLDNPACKKKSIVLFLDGHALKSLTAHVPSNPRGKFLTFELRPTEDSRAAWNAILGKPTFGERDVRVSVGFEDDFALKGVDSKLPVLKLDIISTKSFTLWCVIFALMLFVFVRLVRESNIIRDGAPIADGEQQATGTYSLSKSQGALWFFIIVAAYLLIGIVTGDFSGSINSTAVILLGIGAGTVVGSAVIDESKSTRETLKAEREQAEATKRWLDEFKTNDDKKRAQIAAAEDDAAKKKQLEQEHADLLAKEQQKRSLYRKLTRQSEGFLTDILSDANGIIFHRFQMAAWTLVLAIIFIKEVYENLAMPTFDTTLMSLLGLSAGTYLGLKIPEPTMRKP